MLERSCNIISLISGPQGSRGGFEKEFVGLDKKIKVDRTLNKDASVSWVGISNIPSEDEVYFKLRMIELF